MSVYNDLLRSQLGMRAPAPPPLPDIIIVPSWVKAWRYQGPPQRVPSRAQGRKCTKRWWKAHRARRRGWRYVTVEPDHVMRTADAIICTAAQAAMIRETARRQAA